MQDNRTYNPSDHRQPIGTAPLLAPDKISANKPDDDLIDMDPASLKFAPLPATPTNVHAGQPC